MKTKLLYGLLMGAAVSLTSCSDDEKPQTLPTITTAAVTDFTTTTAIVSGEITDDGNSKITEAGFVYSSVVPEPNIADNKVTVTNIDALTAELTGLISGTTYHVRAYAINKKGTAYGDNRTFTTGNAAPVATNVQIEGVLEVSKTVAAVFTYTDAEGNAEGTSTYQWYMANDVTGAGEVAITDATSSTFTIGDDQNGKFLKVTVTPVAESGTLTGTPVSSLYTNAVGSETVTFTYNGVTVTYGTIIGPSGKKWLDRNLGATRVATAIDDYQAYGDHFQWGRAADGHQIVNRTDGTNENATGENGTTTVTSDDDTPETDQFVIDPTGVVRDWRTTQNDNLWQGATGVNNPCPAGWRLPTTTDWQAEFTAGLNTPDLAFSLLKLTRSGSRDAITGAFANQGVVGLYWSSTPRADTRRGLHFNVGSASVVVSASGNPRAAGEACRCIKN